MDDNKPGVLIVDDEPYNIDLIEAYLLSDYNIHSATNGMEALDIIGSKSIDLVLLDVMMPGMSGYEVCEVLKASNETRFIPVVMVTALSGKDDRIKSIEVGADDFLTKPVDKLELTTRVRSLLKIKKLHDSIQQERDHLELQNRVRSILTTIIPSLLVNIPMEQKKIVIHQMVDMVESIINDNKKLSPQEVTMENAGEICCDAMNELGGAYYAQVSEGDESSFLIKANECPWGKVEAHLNPIMCNLTTGVFTRIIQKANFNGSVKVIKTMGNGDPHCQFLIKKVD